MKKITLSFALCLVAASVGLQRAAAQTSPPAFQLPASAQFPAPARSANGAILPVTTRVVRIYGGAGYFDDSLAAKLRPMLAKAFPSSGPDPVKAVPGTTGTAPTTPENQRKVVEAGHP